MNKIGTHNIQRYTVADKQYLNTLNRLSFSCQNKVNTINANNKNEVYMNDNQSYSKHI